MMTFEKLHDKMPAVLMASDDSRVRTVSDLAFLARHELDLLAEGEDTDLKTPADVAAVKRFLAMCEKAMRKAS